MTTDPAGAEAEHYSYRVTFSPEDGEFVATVAEFDSLSWLAPTRAEALRGLAALVDEVIAEAREPGAQPRPGVSGTPGTPGTSGTSGCSAAPAA